MAGIDYINKSKPRCPHCGADFEVWGGDNPLNLSYEDGGQTNFDCESCGQEFCCVTHIDYKFSTAVTDEAADDGRWGPLQPRHEGEDLCPPQHPDR